MYSLDRGILVLLVQIPPLPDFGKGVCGVGGGGGGVELLTLEWAYTPNIMVHLRIR